MGENGPDKEPDPERQLGPAEPETGLVPEAPDLARTVLDSMTEGVSLSAEDGTIVYTNPAEDRMFGYGPGELVGQHVSVQNAYPPDENARIVAEVIAELKRSGTWRGEWMNRRKDGGVFFTTSRISAVAVGGRPHWLCVQEDVTQQRRVAMELRQSQARLELATEAAELGIWDWDIPSGCMTYSPRAKAISGFDPDREVTFEDVRDIVHPEDRPRTLAMASRALDPEIRERQPYEYRIVWPDGSLRWVLAHGEAIFENVDGEVRAIRYVGSLQDVTERRRLEGAENDAARTLRLAIEAGRMAVWEVDLRTGRISGSPELNRTLGFPEDATPTEEEIRAGYYPGERERVQASGQAAIARGERFIEVEFRYVWPDKSVRWLLLRAEALNYAEGHPTRAVGVLMDITDRKQAEEHLRESEARFRTMTDAVPQIVWITDERGHLEFFNNQWSEYIGGPDLPATADAVTAAYVHPDDAERTMAAFEASRRAGDVFQVEHRIRRHDGAYRWFLVRAVPYRDPATGEIVRWFGASTDIHDRILAGEALREANQWLEERVAETLAERKLFADLIEGTDAFVQVAGPDFRWLAINKAAADEFERIYGVRPKVGDSMLDLLADRPEHRAAVQAVWARALAGEEFTEIGEFGEPGRDYRAYEMKYNALRDGSGRQIGAYQFVYDVTERVREQQRLAEAEAARRDSDALYRAYFENTPEALFVVGVESNGGFVVEEINPAHEAGVGLKLERIRGKRIEDILPQSAAQRVLETYRHVIETDAIYQYRETFNLNGNPQHWDTSLVPMRDEAGRIIRLIGSSRNITRQVVAEEALRQSQKMEAVGQLTGGVAHDFNNLLQIVTGNLGILQRSLPADAARLRRAAANAMTGAERAATLTQRLLAFSRRQPLEPKPISVNRLVIQMSDLLGRTLGETIEIETILAGGLWQVEADSNQLESAILNLAINSRDAMPTGGKLTIETSNTHLDHSYAMGNVGVSPGQYVVICVSDSGLGMNEEAMNRAFEPFFTTKEVGRGTGLGLSQVYGFVKQSSGHVKIYSEVDEGTTVKIYLPRLMGNAAEEATAPEQLAPEGSGSETILVVEDDDDVRTYSVEVLRELGYRVLEAHDGPSALRLLERQGSTVSLLFSDVILPGGMTGAVVAERARLLIPGLKVLFTTGYARNAIVHQGRLDPGVHLLTKPFTYEELAGRIRDILDGPS